MTEAAGLLSASIPLGHPDPDNPQLSFGIEVWLDPPNEVNEIGSHEFISTPRPFLLDNFRKTSTPLQWNRYILLGYFSHIDGVKFDEEWNQEPCNLLHRHKIVWYNFMSHVDRNINIPMSLEAWATQVSQPYLMEHQPSFLQINTIDSSWKSVDKACSNGDEASEWTTVGRNKSNSPVRKTVTLSEPAHRIRPPASESPTATPAYPLSSLTSLRRAGILKQPPISRQSSTTITVPILYHDDHRKPAWISKDSPFASVPDSLPPATTPHATKQPATTPHVTSPPVTTQPATAMIPEMLLPTDASIYSETSTMYPDSRTSSTQVKTNDGTQRITICWTPNNQLSYKDHPSEWTQAALSMLHDLFGNDMGAFYPWGSVSLSNWKSPHSMTAEALMEYLSPKITYIRATKTFIFALRFGFSTKTPVKWLTKLDTKDALRKHKVWATVSNSCSTSGNLVHAGYILMKAPNLTHRIKYLKSLRVQLPENTPFFDIIQLKRTPTNQLIHHLAVQCGEHHVEPLSKALSNLLKGSGSALYLPRLLLGNLSTTQISKYFQTHDDYMKSLRTVTLTPWIDNLDNDRGEFGANGDVITRTSREWALSIKLQSTGHNARCDVINGGYDQVATLLVPRQHYQEVLLEVENYKQRLNPVDRREARFRKNILGFPGIIHIDPSVQEALDMLEKMSSEKIWSSAPPSVRRAGGVASTNRQPVPPAAHSVTSHLSSQSSDSDSDPKSPPPPATKGRASRRTAKRGGKNPQEDASMTQSLDSKTGISQPDLVYLELERKLNRVQAQRDQDLQSTTSQLLDIDKKLKQLDPRLDSLEAKAVQSMQYHVDTNNALTAVQSQMSQMMAMMQDAIASKNHGRTRPHANTQTRVEALSSASTGIATVQSRALSHTSMHPELATASIPSPFQDIDHNGRRSVALTSSFSGGSQHAQSPPKKHLKRSMPDAMDHVTVDDSSSSTFGSTPPLFPFPEPSSPPPIQLLTQSVSLPSENSEMEDAEITPTLAMPDLEDQYKLTDKTESSAPPSPDRGDQG